MAKQLQLRRGTTTQHSSFTGLVGEVTVDTDKDTAVVHDGATAGGKPLSPEAGSTAITTLGTVTAGTLSHGTTLQGWVDASNTGVTFPAGHVIKTVSNEITATGVARTANSYAKVLNAAGNAVFTGQITNVGASNKVLIMLKVNTYVIQNDAADGGAICIYRENDIIYSHPSGHSDYFGGAPSAMSHYSDWQINYLDTSPGTGTNNYFLGYQIYNNAAISVEANNPFHIIMQEIQG